MIILMLEAVITSKTLVSFYETTLRGIPGNAIPTLSAVRT
jgi:hypothetical protein